MPAGSRPRCRIVSSDVDVHPGANDKWGVGFLINTVPYAGGRSAGSLAWAGIDNTFYWIDPKRQICGVLMMQFLPFVDREAVGHVGRIRESGLRGVMNLREWFDQTFASRPNEIGLEWDGAAYTFGEIDARSNRMARALRRPRARERRPPVRLSRELGRDDRSVSRLHQAGRDFRSHQHPVSRPRDVAHPLRCRAEAVASPQSDLPALLAEATAQSGEVFPAVGAGRRRHPPRWSTLPEPPASPKAPCSPTTISPRTRSNLIRRWQITSGAIAFCSPCRCFTSTRSATACTAG